MSAIVQTGLQQLLADPAKHLGKRRVGLVANPSTVDAQVQHAAHAMAAHPGIALSVLFGPEHGLLGQAQYMEHVEGEADALAGVPVLSLYGKTEATLTPKPADLAKLDVLIFDIQDVGSRYYTYAATMALCMRAAAKAKIQVLVLDRPNPIGGTQVEGGGLLPGLENFCGLYPVPQRHGMTVGELATLYNRTFNIGCDLQVLPCTGWRRGDYYEATGLPWVMPSPQMPTVDTAVVYPGMCLLEGTEISEGRGTTRPFELFGAPYVRPDALRSALMTLQLPGVLWRPCVFTPTFNKFRNESCAGLQLHVTDRQAFLPYRTGLAVLWALHQLWPKDFAWRREPYEFRTDQPAIDLLTGTPQVRTLVQSGATFEAVLQAAHFGTEQYQAGRAAALLY